MTEQPDFVYVTYIQATPERIWDALTQPKFTREYWGHDLVSDWQKGSRWAHHKPDDPNGNRMEGTVVESDRPRRLVFTWGRAESAATPDAQSLVTYELEEFPDTVRLTVTHGRFGADEKMRKGISGGWPRVLAGLKSYLETGKAPDIWAAPVAK